ncbi:MAG: hypothetical protein H6Q89_2704 [Myxococcaceae bacterium]|nr:hypothetical protein [Myxococcaceae bacterium]
MEECEGSNLAGATCKSLGFDDGPLTCADCKFVKTLCTKRCGNGAVDLGEGCDGKLGVGACASFGYQACTEACQLDVSHCVPVLFQAGPALSVAKGGPAVIADLEPKGLSDLVMAVPSFGRLETFGYTIEQGFITGRKLSYGRTPLEAAAADLDGDGRMDVVSINDDGAIDRYLYSGTSFAFSTFADAGCPAARFLGTSGPSDAGTAVFALGCADAGAFGAVIVQGATPTTLPLTTSAATLGDLDGDGRLDVLFVSGGGLESRLAPGWDAGATQAVPSSPLAIAAGDFDGDGDLDLAALEPAAVLLWENTGAGFASKSAFPVAGARELKVVDLDLDGRPDVLWQLGDKVQVRRNQGAWSFATTEGTLGAGAPISLAVGDADGDGDPDLASTHSAGGDATVTYLLVNKVR